MAHPMKALVLSFLTSLFVTFLIVRSASRHAALSADDLTGPQKVHSHAVPRVGGLSLLIGVIASCIGAFVDGAEDSMLRWLFLLMAMPAFLSGLFEDVARNVSPRRRLVLNAVSACLGIWLLGGVLIRTDIPGLDTLLQWYPAAIALTLLVVTGVSNSINIIDGFNGLASMCTLIMLLALAYVAYQVGDRFVFQTALMIAGAILGFFFWNFPAGLIFLGDGGAYFLGISVAELSVLLIRHNEEVSPLCPLLICGYPIFETLFSIYRRRVVRGVAAIAPDGIHLHTLLYRRVIRPALHLETERRQIARNSMTSPYLWVLCLLSVIPSILWWNRTPVLTFFIVLFIVSYVLLYWSILKFKTPKWMKFNG